MSTLSIKPALHHVDLPAIRHVDAARPYRWLARGWDDFSRRLPASLAYGVLFAGLGWLLVNYAWSQAHLVMVFTSGFLLVAPFLAIGFYDISHRAGLRHAIPQMPRPFAGARRNLGSIGLYGLMLAFILSVWERLSAILVGLLLDRDVALPSYFSLTALFGADHLAFSVAYLAFGALLAALVFALSVVTLPMLMDRREDLVTAMLTSFWVVRENPVAMLVWASLIVALTAIGYLTWFIGLAVIFPILGHATWHAYRDLVGRK